jgi:hypothetical protein
MTTEGATSKGLLWTGRVLTALPALVLLMSGVMKLTHNPKIVENFTNNLGWLESVLTPIGLAELLSAILYLVPQTAVLGAILVTGYLGGAIAAHARLGQPGLVLPLIMGVMVWGGLFLRDPRLRALLPLRR